MLKPILGVVSAVMLAVGVSVSAADAPTPAAAKSAPAAPAVAVAASSSREDAIKQHFLKLGLSPSLIEPSPVAGLYQVLTARGLFYFSEKGNFLIQGKVYNIDEDMKNETEAVLAKTRKGVVTKYADSMIEFKAKNEKHVINVFTDISCGYCKKLHREMKDYNDLGITVRYLGFPRGGMKSKSYSDMVSVWCADDQQKAMTDAKVHSSIAAKTCTNPVKEHYDLGAGLGVSGTPAILLNDGRMIPGYKPAADLIKILDKS